VTEANRDGAAWPVDGGPGPAGGSTVTSTSGWVLPLVVLVIGMFMSVLDTSIVNVAIPTIQNQFGGTTDDVQWIVTAYTLTLGVVVPATAWLGDRFGLNRVYILALLLFAAGSALCGLAWDLNSLVAFRIVQAIPGGILPVITLSMLYQIVPRQRLGAAMGLYGLGVVFAPAIGPTLGGYLVEYVNWRLIFYINVPIGILGAVAAVLVLPRFPRLARRRFDVLGFITIAAGLFSLLLAASEGESWGWYSYPILGLFTASAFSLALFVVIELEVADPLLDIRIFRYWPFTNSLILISVLTMVLFGVVFYIPQFLQVVQNWKALESGLTLLPQALIMGALMPIAGRIYDRIGPRWPATIGLVIAAGGTYLLHTLTIDTPRERVMWLLAVQAVGLGLALAPIMTGGIAGIPVAQSNVASAWNNVARNVAGAFGVAVLTAIQVTQRAQLTAGRAALVPANTPTPHLGSPGTSPLGSLGTSPLIPPGTSPLIPPATLPPGPLGAPSVGPLGTPPDWLNVWAVYNQTSLRAFAGAIDNLFLICSVLSILGAAVALLLRSGPAPAAASPAPPAMAASPSASADGGPVQEGAVKDGAVARDSVPSTTVGNSSPARAPGEATSRSTFSRGTPDQPS
jgi:EmrB/QacA subfamily drug resistance transporter